MSDELTPNEWRHLALVMDASCTVPSFLAGFLLSGVIGYVLFDNPILIGLMFLAGGLFGLKLIVPLWGRYYVERSKRHYCAHMERSLAKWVREPGEKGELDFDELCRGNCPEIMKQHFSGKSGR